MSRLHAEAPSGRTHHAGVARAGLTVALWALVALLGSGAATAQPVRDGGSADTVSIVRSQHRRITFTRDITRIAVGDTDIASAELLTSREVLTLGRQTGTTSLTAIRDVIQPDSEPAVFQDTNAAKQALLNGQVDAILADLPKIGRAHV